MSKDILTVSVVNFRLHEDGYERNLDHIEGYAEAASRRGADLIVFPEMCATGYDMFEDPSVSPEEKYELAGIVKEKLVEHVAPVTEKYGSYVVVGAPEQAEDGKSLYNAAIAIFPDGHTESYHKIHPYGGENTWCIKGREPYMIQTGWGPVGVSICYDTYMFPELIRYYAKKGARLVLNITAELEDIRYPGGRDVFTQYYGQTLGYHVMSNGIFLASANLTGFDRQTYFAGGSVILGPKMSPFGETVCGVYGGGKDITEPGIYLSAIDLSIASRQIFSRGKKGEAPDFRDDLYRSWR